MLRKITTFLFAALLVLSSQTYADDLRAKKKKPGIPVTLSEVTQTSLNGKNLWCLTRQSPALPGKIVQRGDSLFFVPTTTKLKMKKLKEKKSELSAKQFKKKKKKITDGQNALEGMCNGGSLGPGTVPVGAGSLEALNRAPTEEDLRYLLEKAGFGRGPRDEAVIQIGLTQGLEAAVNEFMRVKAEDAGLEARALNHLDEDLEANNDWVTPRGIRRAWADIFLHTNNAFREKLALFLFSVWTTSQDGVDEDYQIAELWNYIQLLRASSKNPDIRALAEAVTTSPMMLLFLDGATNSKAAPNENYARELMELFTVGPRNLDGQANYTETPGDISKLARRLTGWKVIDVPDEEWPPQTLAVYAPSEHAFGVETLFEGTPHACPAESYQDVLACIFDKHPNTSIYYAKELLEYYLTPDPPRKLIEDFASVIRKYNFNLEQALKELFLSNAFYHDFYKDTLVKNPIEFTMEFLRTLNVPVSVADWAGVEWQLERMGMAITKAPSVFWWDDSVWSSPTSNLEKHNMLVRFLREESYQNDRGWSPQAVLPIGDEVTARDVLHHAAKKMGVPLDATKEAIAFDYMTNEIQWDESIEPFAYDNRIPYAQRAKGLGAYILMALSPEFQLK